MPSILPANATDIALQALGQWPLKVHQVPLALLANVSMQMTTPEALTWFSLLLNASSYMEWGVGGTIVMASWRALQYRFVQRHTGNRVLRINAVVSRGARMQELWLNNHLLKRAQATGRLILHELDASRVLDGLHNRAARVRAYAERVNASCCCFDLIVVGGRFREVCMMHALRLSHSLTTVLVNDSQRFTNHRWRQAASEFYEVSTTIGTLTVMRPTLRAIRLARTGDSRFERSYTQLLTEASDAVDDTPRHYSTRV